MDEECDELSDIQQLEEDLCEMPTDQDEDEDEDGDEDEYGDGDEDDYEDSNISTSNALNDIKVEENPSSRNGLDISVKLEVSILEGEENQNSSKDQQVNQLTFVNGITIIVFAC